MNRNPGSREQKSVFTWTDPGRAARLTCALEHAGPCAPHPGVRQESAVQSAPETRNPKTRSPKFRDGVRGAVCGFGFQVEARLRNHQAPDVERLVIYCQTTGVSAAHATHCATYCTPCRPLKRAFSGWIRTPPPTPEEEYLSPGQILDALARDGSKQKSNLC